MKEEKVLNKINEEIKKAEKIVEDAADNCAKHNYNNNSFQYYQQRFEYLKGLYMARTIIEREIRNEKR